MPRVTFFYPGADDELDGRPNNNLGDAYAEYSLRLARALERMSIEGHSFGRFEFPDYGAEGYFPIKSWRAGRLAIQELAVRLHSPEIMLFRDNCIGLENLTIEKRALITRELYVYRYCDTVLFGGEAMLDRVEQECRRYGLSIRAKSVQVEHPHPPVVALPSTGRQPGSETRVGYIGRLERRKGILDFFRTVAGSASLVSLIKDRQVIFDLFGRDLPLPDGGTNGSAILELARSAGIEGRVRIVGHQSQEALWKQICQMDALIYPSRFENYPNALLEALSLGVPALISNRGAMPHISSWSPAASFYDPLASDAGAAIEAFVGTLGARPPLDLREAYRERASRMNRSILEYYRTPAKPAPARSEAAKGTVVSFVVTHYQQPQLLSAALDSVKRCMHDGDECIVVDDASSPSDREEARRIVGSMGFMFLALERNGGPAAARNAGVAASSRDLVQFLDGDDLLTSSGIEYVRSFMSAHDDVDMAYGGMRAFGEARHLWWPKDASAAALMANFAHSAIMIKRRVYLDIGGQDVESRVHFEDWAFNAKFAMAGHTGEVLPAITLEYRVLPGSRTMLFPEHVELSEQRVITSAVLDRLASPNQRVGEMIDMLGVQAIEIRRGERALDPALNRAIDMVHRMRNVAMVVKRYFPPAYWLLRWGWRVAGSVARPTAPR
jgi:glycosyltransferase involved in cell wall biosynthesis